MKISLLIFTSVILMISVFNNAHATHTMGGQITATPVSGQNFTYHLKFTLYTDPDADIEFGTMEISFGHGDPANLDGENDFQRAFLNADSLVMKDTLLMTHTFPDQFDTLYAENPGQENGTFPPLFAIENGQLIWDAPTYGGKYTSAVQVKEWRQIEGQWQQIGYVIRDLTIHVQDTVNHTNGINYVDYNDNVTGTEGEAGQEEVILFPNPSQGRFLLKIKEPWIGSQLSVLDISGKMVYQAAVTQEEVLLELPHLSSGLYVLTLQKGFKKRSFTLVKR